MSFLEPIIRELSQRFGLGANAGALAITAIMWIWLAVEMVWVDYPGLQIACFIWGGIILLLALLPPVRRYLKTRA